MHELMRVFDPDGFIPRRLCGAWTPELLAIHQGSDAVIWASYTIIAFLLWKAYRLFRQGRLDPVPVERNIKLLMVEFTGFITCCGVTHLHQVIVFWYPCYRWFGVWSLLTALCSAVTVGTLSVVLGMSIRPLQGVQNGG